MKHKIVVVDDHPVIRNGMKLMLNSMGHSEVVGEASNGQEFLKLLETKEVDIALMDIKMPVMNGLDATKIATERFPNLKVIALSMFEEEEYVVKMIEAGAKGYLLKNVDKDELDIAIRVVSSGNNYYCNDLSPVITNKFLGKSKNKDEKVVELTKREVDVLKLICHGFSNQEISEKLFLSQRTVESHRANLIEKTGSKNSIHLVLYAIKNKLIDI